ncbi:MAG: SpoIID/LytB domain-containing protein [Actinobacteria bacterium]|nr:SpoIID/LytB domain-containing protein [Actinomycetota bacterium]
MRRRIALVVALGAALALPPAATGRAAGSFTFYGSGFGHGLGLSQWGAYGLARDGWTHQQVLTRFYSGTKVGRADSPPKTLRIGLVQGKSRIRLAAEAGPVDLLVGDPQDGATVGQVPEGETWAVRVVGSKYQVVNAAGKRVGGQLWGSPAENLYARFEPNGARVKVPEAGHTYAHGFLEFNIYVCGRGCRLRLILPIEPQPYLYGLAEVPSSWPMEALQAQAVAARTYAFSKAGYGQHRNPCNCALYATAADQVYAGWDKESGVDGDRWVKAVDDTDGEVVKYQGGLIQAFYSASSGGYTENNENVWGGTPIPYLRGVCDPGDYTPANSSAVWTATMSAAEVTRKLGLGIGTVTGFKGIVRGVSGRIITTVVEGTEGSATISGTTLRVSLGLRDDRVWVNADRHVTGKIRLKYDDLNCKPGLPSSRQVAVNGGLRQKFEAGTIFFKEGVGAHELSGAVLDFYLSKGGPNGKLGFPTSDVTRRDNGSTSATFERGTIVCSEGGACQIA